MSNKYAKFRAATPLLCPTKSMKLEIFGIGKTDSKIV